ncbi:hypothetical protein BG015_005301 [Linnemannia schmuckeri]|uniref:RING-type domain-containing protein n=1 Tax=Linnemannia schmuckeri TaxID=64567 RepID=A0A9P5S4I6_9FUNG|nr:hypothetical protein BG015_005301 [Linnemannia schmuckeri]
MLEHIHCNKCFRIDPVKDVSYWLTNCGHILCQQCLDRAQTREEKKRKAELDDDGVHTQENNNGSESICAICKKPCECISIPENVGDLPVDIQPFFRPLANLCNTALDAWKFQEQNLTKLIDHLHARTKRQNEVLTKARTELLNLKAMKSENQTLKKENEKLKQQIQELQKYQSGGGENGVRRRGGGGGAAPIMPVTPQIRVIDSPADRVQPSTSSRNNNQRPIAREEPTIAKRAYESQLPPPPQPDTLAGGGDTGMGPKRTRSAMSNICSNVYVGRPNSTPRPPPATRRISLIPHQRPGFMSPRLTLTHQPNDVLQSPRRPPSVHTVHQIAQPRYPNASLTVPQLQGVALQQGSGLRNHIAPVLGGQLGYGYQQTPVPVQALNQDHVYLTPQASWPPASGLPQTGMGYSVLSGVRQIPGGEVVVAHDPLIRTRGAASTARTTWQQQQQQRHQQQQQQQLRQQQIQEQQQQQQQQLQQPHQQFQLQQAQQQHGYPIALRSAVPRPVTPRTHYG